MLQAKVTHLRAPAQEEGGQRQHCRDIAHSDVGDVDAPGGENGRIEQNWRLELDRFSSVFPFHSEWDQRGDNWAGIDYLRECLLLIDQFKFIQ